MKHLPRALLGAIRARAMRLARRRSDLARPTYLEAPRWLLGGLSTRLRSLEQPPDTDGFRTLPRLARHYVAHRFDLLGSGWVRVDRAPNEGRADPCGLVNRANLEGARRIWRLIDREYSPIDWQLDCKSGYRWSEHTWYRDVRYGHLAGVDVKIPWELSRMQHLPQLAVAFALAAAGRADYAAPEVYCREFRNQILDFVATNPPRFGVNWSCTMDVGIRVANWLLAYDLFRAYGAKFDDGFEAELGRSVYDHGVHIVGNLEWNTTNVANHYLANIAGLNFAASYLPRSGPTDAWLAFSRQELIRETERQFHPDGSNFEMSTSYHRLCGEMVVYCTALVLGLGTDKLKALEDYDRRELRVGPGWSATPSAWRTPGEPGSSAPFPPTHFERIEKIAEFSLHAARPDARIAQFGDNDSGRFFKLCPTVPVGRPGGEDLREDHLDHRHLPAAVRGLIDRPDFDQGAETGFETRVVRALVGRSPVPSYHDGSAPAAAIVRLVPATRENDVPAPGLRPALRPNPGVVSATGLWSGLRLYGYPGFGLYVYRSDRAFLAIRCGGIGQNDHGGHAHNDALSFEFAVGRTPLVVDCGTYVYTADPVRRNRFRSTAMHNTLVFEGQEQNPWPRGMQGLFRLAQAARPRVIEFHERRFVGEHSGFTATHRRTLSLCDAGVEGLDECARTGERTVRFHLHPDVALDSDPPGEDLRLLADGSRIRLYAAQATLTVEASEYSPGYGRLVPSRVVELRSSAREIRWGLEILPPRPSPGN